MNSFGLKNWRLKRDRGFRHFLIFDSILKIGLPATLGSQIFFYLYDFGFTISKITELFTPGRIFFFILSVITTGLLFAIIVWLISKYEVND